jgi:hypothetical protein
LAAVEEQEGEQGMLDETVEPRILDTLVLTLLLQPEEMVQG